MKKVLIIEDDQLVTNIYRNKLAVEGFQVETAPDGESGLNAARSFRPSVVMLDLMLPRMTGVEVLKKLRSEPELASLPVIVFSNTYRANLVQEAWKAGATKCLLKANCTPRQVVEAVRNSLGLVAAPATALDAPPNAAAPVTPPAPAPLSVPMLSGFPPCDPGAKC